MRPKNIWSTNMIAAINVQVEIDFYLQIDQPFNNILYHLIIS